MTDRQSQPNLRPMRAERLDGKKESATFGSRLKLYWAPIGTISAILGVAVAAAVTTAKPFAGKADAKTVARDEAKQASDHDILIGLQVEVGDLKDTTAWTRDVVGQLAAREGVATSPTPTPHPLPTRTP